MAAVMLAGMVPPIALALATVVRPGLFTAPERENGKAGWLLGASFITEGAIPFAAADPLRVIPAIMAGSAVTGAPRDGARRRLRAPHGGIFVLFAVDNSAGLPHRPASPVSLVAAAAVIALKSHRASPRHRPRHRLMPHRLTTPATYRKEPPCPARPSSSAPPSACTPAPPRSSPRRPASSTPRSPINGVDASSSLLIMTLGAKNGDTVEVESDDQAAVDTIAALVEQDLDALTVRRHWPERSGRRSRRPERRSRRPAGRGSPRGRRPPAPARAAPR